MSKMNMSMITVEGEANKVINAIRTSPSRYATKSTGSDMKKLGFDSYEPGMFVAVLPINSDGQVDANDAAKAKKVMTKLRATKLNNEFIVLSSGCSFKFAKEHFEEVHSTFKTAAIAFSTPENLQILSEDPSNY